MFSKRFSDIDLDFSAPTSVSNSIAFMYAAYVYYVGGGE